MKLKSPVTLVCPHHGGHLEFQNDGFICEDGCRYPVIGEIARFVDNENYAAGFGLQWNEYWKTQLDSYTGLSISKDRLERLLGGDLTVVRNKKVLEAGCGAGRFTEILLENRAEVFATDLSSAVDANYQNCKDKDGYFVCQGDILNLPVEDDAFDIVICIGVIQHTPVPEETIAELCTKVKPGGVLVIDHYTQGYGNNVGLKAVRKVLLKASPEFALQFTKNMVGVLWPIHRITWKLWTHPLSAKLRVSVIFRLIVQLLRKISPVVDYQSAYPQLTPEMLRAWAILDTHDTLTDIYKHLRSQEEIIQALNENGMVDINAVYAGNGVEARAFKLDPAEGDKEETA